MTTAPPTYSDRLVIARGTVRGSDRRRVHIRDIWASDRMGKANAICGATPSSGWTQVAAPPTCPRCLSIWDKALSNEQRAASE